jgi:hypothetical protein
MAVDRTLVDSETGIPELIHRLKDDSKRLLTGELRLAKLEVHDGIKSGGKDLMWLASAFGAGVVALVALTLVLVTLIGRLASGHMWVGALVVGIIEVVVGMLAIKSGVGAFKDPSYSLAETRESLKDTATWVKEEAKSV